VARNAGLHITAVVAVAVVVGVAGRVVWVVRGGMVVARARAWRRGQRGWREGRRGHRVYRGTLRDREWRELLHF